MFFKFPYTDMYAFNLDWMIKYLEETKANLEQWKEIVDGLGTIVHSVNGQTGDVQLGTLVNSVNGQTGAVQLGTLVNSVNGKTGAVEIDNDDINALKIEVVLQSTDAAETFTPAVVRPLFSSGIRFIIINDKEFYSISEDGSKTLFNPFKDQNLMTAQDHAPTQQEAETYYSQGIRFVQSTVSDVKRMWALEKIGSNILAYDLDETNGANIFNEIDAAESIEDYSETTLQEIYKSGQRILFQDTANGIRKFYALLGNEVDGYTGYIEYDPVNYFDTQFVTSLKSDLNRSLEEITGNRAVGLVNGSYINTSGTPIDLTPVSNSQWKHAVLDCTPGDQYTVIGAQGISSARVWTFIDLSGVTVTQRSSDSGEINETITAPAGAVKLIFNTKSTGSLYTGVLIKDETKTAIAEFDNMLGLEPIEFTYAQYYTTSDTTSLAQPVVNKAYKSALIDCSPMDLFTISGIGGASQTISTYAFYDSNGALISRSGSTTLLNEVVKAPINAAKMVININLSNGDPVSYKGALLTDGVDIQQVVPHYYADQLESKIAELNAASDNSPLNGDSFIFMTDYHVQANERNSAALIRQIMDKTGTGFVVFGGDAQDYEQTFAGAVEMNNRFKADYKHIWPSMFNVIGNHEFNAHYATEQDSSMVLSYAQAYGFFDKQTEYRFGAHDGYGDFYVDNTAQKIRYFFISCASRVAIEDDQRFWLFSEFEKVPDGWYIIVFSHLTFKYVTSDPTKIFVASGPNNIASCMTKLNNRTTHSTGGHVYDFTNSGATAIAIIGGHTHYDASTDYEHLSDIDGNPVDWQYVPVIATTTDAIYRQQDNTGTLIRTPGTITEQAFDVVHIDLTNRKIIMKRIGAGSDRVFEY